MRTNGKTLKPRNIRKQLGVNQQQFWNKVGVTQSAGSRYEGGRVMPKPVRELVRLVHVEGIDLTDASGDDFRVARKLRATQPQLYRRLAAADEGKPRGAGRGEPHSRNRETRRQSAPGRRER
jgi:transcriptional regulator with XRE-family HTH domain